MTHPLHLTYDSHFHIQRVEANAEMPQFTTTSVEEAQRLTGGGKRQKDLAAYIESVNGLSPGSAGWVIPV